LPMIMEAIVGIVDAKEILTNSEVDRIRQGAASFGRGNISSVDIMTPSFVQLVAR